MHSESGYASRRSIFGRAQVFGKCLGTVCVSKYQRGDFGGEREKRKSHGGNPGIVYYLSLRIAVVDQNS
jgi:hypothetical protein